jgi:hypothetical protein
MNTKFDELTKAMAQSVTRRHELHKLTRISEDLKFVSTPVRSGASTPSEKPNQNKVKGKL